MKTLEKTKETIKPDRDWLQSDRAALLSHVRESMPAKPIGFKGATKALLGRVFPREAVQFVRGPVIAVIAVIAVVTGGSMASVSASGRSLPGDFLYPIKIATEQTRLALTSSKIERLELKVAFVERRVLELQAVADSVDPEKHEHVKATAGYLKRDLDTVERQIDEVKMLLGSVEAVKKLDGRITEIVSMLGQIKDGLVDDNKRSVSEAEDAAVNTSVKVVQVLIESKRNPDTQNDVSDEELAESISSKVDALEQDLAETAEKRKFSSEDEAEAVEKDAEAEAAEVASDEGADEGVDATSTSEESSREADDDDENLDEIFGSDPLLAAANSLEEARRLLENNELDAIPEKLLEAIAAAKRAEREAEERAAEQEAQESSESDEQVDSGSDSTSTQETLDSSNSSTETTASSTET